MTNLRRIRVQLDTATEVSFGRRPIAIVIELNGSGRVIGVGQGIVERDGFVRCRLRLGPILIRWRHSDRGREAVIIRQSDITKGIRRIEVDRLLEITEALLKSRGRIFVPVIYSLK